MEMADVQRSIRELSISVGGADWESAIFEAVVGESGEASGAATSLGRLYEETLQSRDRMGWDLAKVEQWLKEMKVSGSIIEAAKEKRVNGPMLAVMDKGDWEELGVKGLKATELSVKAKQAVLHGTMGQTAPFSDAE